MQRNLPPLMQEEFLNICEGIIPFVLTGLTVSSLKYFEFSYWFSVIAGVAAGTLAIVSLDKQRSARRKARWEEYSEKDEDSLTIDIFKRDDLFKHLNTTCGTIQFGASTGHFLHIFRERYNKRIIGYDFTDSSIKKLKEKNIPTRQIDLNSIDQESNTLSYKRELDEDFANPTNILLIRILNHLDFNAMNLLFILYYYSLKTRISYFHSWRY